MPQSHLSASLLSLSHAAPGKDSFDATLQQVVDLACAGVHGCEMAGITILEKGGPVTAVATSEAAAAVDAIQYRLNAGPCLDAYRNQVVNRIDSTDSDERWPEFSRNAAAAGVHSALSFPLVVNGDGIGALNLYSLRHAGFDKRDERSGAVFASHASVTLANARAFWQVDAMRRALEGALEAQGIVDQAKGVVMARDGRTAANALADLERAALEGGHSLLETAQEVVDGTRRGGLRP